MVPHLTTALTGPINELEQRMLDAMPAIERWFRLEWMEHTPPFYAAVDLRNAGFKLAPVDTDLFPTGWSHLSAPMLPLAVQAAMAAIEKICPEARNLLIVPANGTPNSFYLDDLAQLVRVFNLAGLNVRLGSIDPALKAAVSHTRHDGSSLLIEPVQRSERRLGLKHFDPCTILLNNDLRAGTPGILEELFEQYLLPPLQAGWSMRRKHLHSRCYEEVTRRLGKLIGIDPWLVHPLFDACAGVDLTSAAGVDAVLQATEAQLIRVKRKYKEYGIKEKAFIVIKADHASHPLGIARVRDGHDLDRLRAQLSALGQAQQANPRAAHPTNDFLIQEGVLTQERVNDAVAEPVVYTMDRYVVGGFYRVHAQRGPDEALNAPGSSFVPLAFEHATQLPQLGAKPGASEPNRFYMYGVVARLALLGAAYELEATDPALADDASDD